MTPMRTLSRDRARRRERKLWHNVERNTAAFGCADCPNLTICGGLNVERALFGCLDYCCGGKDTCDAVCRQNRNFVDRVREINGFELDNIPSLRSLPAVKVDDVVPLLFHASSRQRPLDANVVALPLSKLVDHRGARVRYATISEIRSAFRLGDRTRVIATGTATDPPLENWWKLGRMRRDIVRGLVRAGVEFSTTPNFSLFSDQPRWDDLHSIKRIAIVHEEFLAEGMVCALHVNARTDTDIDRWAKYIQGRPEIQDIAYEFLTGSGWPGRKEMHAEWLEKLAQSVDRPLTLTIRGAAELLPRLSASFTRITVIESTAFMRTMKRQRGRVTNHGPAWSQALTPVGAPLDDLFEHNKDIMERWLSSLIVPSSPSLSQRLTGQG